MREAENCSNVRRRLAGFKVSSLCPANTSSYRCMHYSCSFTMPLIISQADFESTMASFLQFPRRFPSGSSRMTIAHASVQGLGGVGGACFDRRADAAHCDPSPCTLRNRKLLRASCIVQYHFRGTRATNNPEKPEWFFQHLSGIVRASTQFLVTRSVQARMTMILMMMLLMTKIYHSGPFVDIVTASSALLFC